MTVRMGSVRGKNDCCCGLLKSNQELPRSVAPVVEVVVQAVAQSLHWNRLCRTCFHSSHWVRVMTW